MVKTRLGGGKLPADEGFVEEAGSSAILEGSWKVRRERLMGVVNMDMGSFSDDANQFRLSDAIFVFNNYTSAVEDISL